MCTGALGPDYEEPILPKESRSSAGCNGIDIKLGTLNRDPGSCSFKHMFIPPRVSRYIWILDLSFKSERTGACPSHVEADDGDLGL